MKTEGTKKVALIDIGATFFIFSVKKKSGNNDLNVCGRQHVQGAHQHLLHA